MKLGMNSGDNFFWNRVGITSNKFNYGPRAVRHIKRKHCHGRKEKICATCGLIRHFVWLSQRSWGVNIPWGNVHSFPPVKATHSGGVRKGWRWRKPQLPIVPSGAEVWTLDHVTWTRRNVFLTSLPMMGWRYGPMLEMLKEEELGLSSWA